MRRHAATERAQASAELVAIVPLLVAGALFLAQGLVAGWALLSAGEAARSAARIAHVGGNAEAAARAALPDALGSAEVSVRGSSVEVEVRAPALLPGVPGIPVHASASLDPEGGG
ncbi:MAG: pilus assembly protein [Actinomycetota bacterium]|nr:pilus assembly protein [Actinomycetota bacterium]